MKFGFSEPQRSFISKSQNARVVTEAWVGENMYCPNCGHSNLNQFPANVPVADFFCPLCYDQYELKSQKKEFGQKIANGAYATKIERLQSDTSPNLILLRYDQQAATVRDISVIPKRFFVPSIIERRKPLGPHARRAGWVDSSILIGRIPRIGRVSIVRKGVQVPKEDALLEWQQTAFLDGTRIEQRGWLLEVIRCIDAIETEQFSLDQLYDFEQDLQKLYPDNNNIRPKIRQQLQVLRDMGYIEFIGQGQYKLRRYFPTSKTACT